MNTKAIALLLGLGIAATLTACGGATTTETSPAAPEASPAAPAAPVSPAASPTTSPSP